MKKLLNLLLALLLPAALCLPVFAEGEEAAPAETAQPEKKAAPKPAPKKKAKKKKKAEPVSEYKFKSEGTDNVYKFDRKADPIVKAKKKPAPKKKAPAKKAAPAPSAADTENATGAAPVTE